MDPWSFSLASTDMPNTLAWRLRKLFRMTKTHRPQHACCKNINRGPTWPGLAQAIKRSLHQSACSPFDGLQNRDQFFHKEADGVAWGVEEDIAEDFDTSVNVQWSVAVAALCEKTRVGQVSSRSRSSSPALDVFSVGWVIIRPDQGAAAEMLPKMTHDPTPAMSNPRPACGPVEGFVQPSLGFAVV